MYDDDDLDRALMALPLEPLPDGLRASILSAIRVAPGPILTRWETAGVGVILALATWLSILFMTGRVSAGTWVSSNLSALGYFLVNPTSLMWIAVGLAVALCLTLASIPRRQAAR